MGPWTYVLVVHPETSRSSTNVHREVLIDKNPCGRTCARTSSKKAGAISPFSGWRYIVNTVGAQAESPMRSPTNQHSLGIESRSWRSRARSIRSGARPVLVSSRLKAGESSLGI